MVIMHIGGHTNMRMVACRSGWCCAGRCAPDAAATPQALPPVTLSIPPALHCRCPTMTISTFDDLLQAARQPAQPQRLLLVFAGALSGAGGQPPGDRQIDTALQRLEESVKAGDLAGLIPFDRQGEAVQLL